MPLFPSTDYTFCDYKKCNRKKTCARHWDHYKKRIDEESIKHISFFIIPDLTKCDNYWKI